MGMGSLVLCSVSAHLLRYRPASLSARRRVGTILEPLTSGPSEGSDSMRSAGIVSRPCHDVASLKYSFWAPVRYGPWLAGDWWGEFSTSSRPSKTTRLPFRIGGRWGVAVIP